MKTQCIVSDVFVLYQIQLYEYNTIQFRLLKMIRKDREVSADTAATETYYMMGLLKFRIKRIRENINEP